MAAGTAVMSGASAVKGTKEMANGFESINKSVESAKSAAADKLAEKTEDAANKVSEKATDVAEESTSTATTEAGNKATEKMAGVTEKRLDKAMQLGGFMMQAGQMLASNQQQHGVTRTVGRPVRAQHLHRARV